MADGIQIIGGVRVLTVSTEGTPIATRREVTDLIAAAWGEHADMVAIPTARQGAGFFDLRTGVAGEMLQMCVTYGTRVTFVGAIPDDVAGSKALRDFIHESNQGRSVWFVADIAELDRRLAAAA